MRDMGLPCTVFGRFAILALLSLIALCIIIPYYQSGNLKDNSVLGKSDPNPLYPNIWNNLSVHGPPPLGGQQMVYDPVTNLFYMFGGQSTYLTTSQLWVFNPSNMTWRMIQARGIHPGPRADETLVCICSNKSPRSEDFLLLFGGWYNNTSGRVGRYNDTWLFYPSNYSWVTLSKDEHPSGRSDAAASFDMRDNLVLLYGGYNGSYLDDTWQFDVNNLTWNKIILKPEQYLPPPLADARMAYDWRANVYLLFGGNNNLNPYESYNHYNNIWVYLPQNNTWSDLRAINPPSPRDYSAFVYDPNDDLFLMQGGYGDGTALGDTWLYSFKTNRWTQLLNATISPARFASSFSFDTRDDVMLLYGGTFNDTAYSDTLAFIPYFRGVVNVNWHPTKLKIGETVKFYASISQDPAPPVEYFWEFDNRENSTLRSPKFIFTTPGIHYVSVGIEDALGKTYSETIQIKVYDTGLDSNSLLSLFIIVSVLSASVLVFGLFPITRRKKSFGRANRKDVM